ncbi:red chlorophyll catabolite reductase [Ranunculus cassubicifolius]
MVTEVRLAFQLDAPGVVPPSIIVGWNRPPPLWLLANIDGSAIHKVAGGAGCVLRDADARFIWGASLPSRIGSSLLAEVMAAWLGLLITSKMGITNLIIQSDSQVDFVLGSWIHSKLPMGALNITTLTSYLNNTTDAPRFLLEFIQSSPTSLILILDLPHRKDLILYPNYLNTFYTDTQLDQFRQQLHKLPEITPYFSASLYIRCALSPTAVSVVIDCGADGQGRLDEIITDHIGPVAKEMLEIWLDKCACGGRAMEEQERIDLKKRDALVNKKTLDIDLASGLPRLFGPDVASRVIEGIQKYFVS